MIFDFVFVVLVYRNTDDLKDFFSHFTVRNAKAIVVNSYYDDESEAKFKEIAFSNDADFFTVPNNGYGYGNNRGCEYALRHYEFRYLVISNADILIKALDVNELDNNVVTAPCIKTLKGKLQNPAKPWKVPFLDELYLMAFTHSFKLLILPIGVNKVCREIFLRLIGKKRIYEPHGAFIILPYGIIKKEYPLFNESIFLFAEEDHIAMKFRTHKVGVVYNPKIKITHKEDGSTSTLDNQQKILAQSFKTYYRYWHNKKQE